MAGNSAIGGDWNIAGQESDKGRNKANRELNLEPSKENLKSKIENCKELGRKNSKANRGITEIVGNPGTGKTKLALWTGQRAVRILYLSINSSGIADLPPTVLFVKIRSFLHLRVFIAQEAKRLVKTAAIERIVIDSLESFLYTEEAPRREAGAIFRMVDNLRFLSYGLGVEVFITNNSYSSWNNEGVKIANSYIGLPWEYMVNTRFLVERERDCRTIRRVSATGKRVESIFFTIGEEPVEFNITDAGVEFVQPS